MNELKMSEALLEDQRAVNTGLRKQLEQVTMERDTLSAVRKRALTLVEAQLHHGGLHHDHAEPLLKILRGDLGVVLKNAEEIT